MCSAPVSATGSVVVGVSVSVPKESGNTSAPPTKEPVGSASQPMAQLTSLDPERDKVPSRGELTTMPVVDTWPPMATGFSVRSFQRLAVSNDRSFEKSAATAPGSLLVKNWVPDTTMAPWLAKSDPVPPPWNVILRRSALKAERICEPLNWFWIVYGYSAVGSQKMRALACAVPLMKIHSPVRSKAVRSKPEPAGRGRTWNAVPESFVTSYWSVEAFGAMSSAESIVYRSVEAPVN